MFCALIGILAPVNAQNTYTITKKGICDALGQNIYDKKQRQSVYAEMFAPYTADNKPAKWSKRSKYYPNKEHSFSEDIAVLTYSYKRAKNDVVIANAYYNLQTKQLLHVFYSTSLSTYTLDPYSCSRAIVNMNDAQSALSYSIVLNEQGDSIGRFSYKGVYPPSYGYMAAKGDNGKWGLVDVNMQQVLPFNYIDIHTAISGDGHFLGVREENNKWRLMSIDSLKPIIAEAFDEVLLYRKNDFVVVKNADKYALYNTTTKQMSGYYDVFRYNSRVSADSLMHGGCAFVVGHIQRRDTAFGMVNAFGEEMIPAVLKSETQAYRALNHYKNLPLQHFDDTELKRLILYVTKRERVYKLTTIIPETDWDY